MAPTLIIFEASSVLRNKVYREILKDEEAKEIINQLSHLDIVLIYSEDLLDIAWGKERY